MLRLIVFTPNVVFGCLSVCKKMLFIDSYFSDLNNDIERAKILADSDEFFLEGILVLICRIAALAKLRYPQEEQDWRAFKMLISEYDAEQRDIYENIDLLYFYSWKRPENQCKNKCSKLANYEELRELFKQRIGNEEKLENNTLIRYQKRDYLVKLAKTKRWFNNENFEEHIELFSNLQILYQFGRCELVHEMRTTLFGEAYTVNTSKKNYRDKHQVTKEVIMNTVNNIFQNLRDECSTQSKWPFEL